ncbi:hypothetical protein CORC01_03882 [Colletotrichum orchidophilum]|uniref:Uncharacterized protein n=1 Tax=Colletotrichum orchidophilum TaxID=1209926 RepID=A0A1G4BHM7_9PEZI|nr:uncharacterized protein CORC01_03882 [Colletotrichum orchidophilum]OHF00808.1 hypothetical protein CORC01_03882 [Colletotrichum orchidophilum]
MIKIWGMTAQSQGMLVSHRHHRSVGDPWAPATPWDPGRHSELVGGLLTANFTSSGLAVLPDVLLPGAGLTFPDDAKGASTSLISPANLPLVPDSFLDQGEGFNRDSGLMLPPHDVEFPWLKLKDKRTSDHDRRAALLEKTDKKKSKHDFRRDRASTQAGAKMSSRHRNRIIPTSSILISYLASITHATFINDFSAYPAAARPCLDSAAAASGCTGNTVTEMNTCLCGNGGNFVLGTSKCVENQAKDKLGDVYEMLLTSCTDSRTPLGISQAQFLDADDNDDAKSTTSSSSTSSTITTTTTTSQSTTMLFISTSAPPTETPSSSTTSTSLSLTTYKSVIAGGVTVTVTRGVETVPTGAASGNQATTNAHPGPSHTALAAGLVGGLAFLLGALALVCFIRKKQRKERKGQVGTGGKFAALSSATSLTTMSASPPRGQATTAYHGVNDQRPDTANTINMAVGTPGWDRQQQGPQSPQHWQNNSPGHYGQPTATWPSPVANGDGTTGTWGFSPVSQYYANSSRGHDPSSQTGTWNAHAVEVAAAPVPAPHPSHSSNNTYSPVFELPGDQIQAVEADSTPVGHVQPPVVLPPSQSIQSTPAQMRAQPVQPAPAHYGMPRQIDDALQISRIELPPPRYSGPSSSEWVSEDKKFG